MKKNYLFLLLFIFIMLSGSANYAKTTNNSMMEQLIFNKEIECRVNEDVESNGINLNYEHFFAKGKGYEEPEWAKTITADFTYPQISKPTTPEEIKTNLMILDMLWKTFGTEMYLANIDNFLSGNSPTGVLSASAECKILSFNEHAISIETKTSSSGITWNDTCTVYATISIDNGAYQTLFDIVDIDSLIKAVRNGVFTVLHGTYTGGWDADEMGSKFANAIIAESDEKRIAELNAYLPKWWNNGISEQTINIGNDAYSYFEYNPNYFGNFGIDQKNLYITFYYYDALDSYVTLAIPICNGIKNGVSLIS